MKLAVMIAIVVSLLVSMPVFAYNQTLLEQAIYDDIEWQGGIVRDGLYVYQPKVGHKVVVIVGREGIRPWLDGMSAYGVRYQKGREICVAEGYQKSFPKDVKQIARGLRRAGAFEDVNGDLIVPGIKMLPTGEKSKALVKIEKIRATLENKIKELQYEYDVMKGFIQPGQLFDIKGNLRNKKWPVRKFAIQESSTFPSEDRCVILIAGMKDQFPRVREEAARGCTKFKDKRLIQPLTDLLKDINSTVRYTATFGLIKQGAKSALPKLQTMALRDPAQPVRKMAAEAYDYIKNGQSPF